MNVSPTVTDAAETAAVLSLQETPVAEADHQGPEQAYSSWSVVTCHIRLPGTNTQP
ncbi:hypothetical protein [Kitasatospora sp. NPDC004531]